MTLGTSFNIGSSKCCRFSYICRLIYRTLDNLTQGITTLCKMFNHNRKCSLSLERFLNFRSLFSVLKKTKRVFLTWAWATLYCSGGFKVHTFYFGLNTIWYCPLFVLRVLVKISQSFLLTWFPQDFYCFLILVIHHGIPLYPF
jgi:hypothetical protein